MAPRHTVFFLSIACLSLFPLAASGQIPTLRTAADTARVLEFIKQQNHSNYRGWQYIIMYCHVVDGPQALLKTICEAFDEDKPLLEAATRLQVVPLQDAFSAHLWAGSESALVLELAIQATSDGSTPGSAATTLTVWASGTGRTTPTDTLGRHRTGRLVFWEQTAVGATTGHVTELAKPMTDAVGKLLKRFLTEFLDAQR